MMPGHEDREDGLPLAGGHPLLSRAAMMPGHEDREDQPLPQRRIEPVLAAMMPGHEDREDRRTPWTAPQ